MAKYEKGDCRRHNRPSIVMRMFGAVVLFFKWLAMKVTKGEKKAFFIPASSGPNRHDRRVEAKRTRTVFALKGTPGFKLLRRMFRKYGVDEVIKCMNGERKKYTKKERAFIAKTAFYRALNKTYAKGAK